MIASPASIKMNGRLGADFGQSAEEFHIDVASVAIPGPPRRRVALLAFHVGSPDWRPRPRF
jgi:hypothetical protein